MSAILLSGKEASSALLEGLKPEVAKLDPKLVVVQVGEDPASSSYIKQKFKACETVGMRSEHKHLPEDTSFEDLMSIIDNLNNDDDVTGFIVQLPLPKHLTDKEPEVNRAIDPKKDVDGFGAYNLGKMFLSKDYEDLPPATPSGIIALLEYYKIPVEGKHIVIVGRSNIVGKPIAVMLINRSATVTVCNSRTKDLAKITKQADILICAVGKAHFITKDMVKDGVVVIDVGVNRTDDGLKGDVDFKSIEPIASAITPVPGGVGPMTVTSLIRNCVRAKERQINN
ncbi:MAG: bifunctional methylenetetrahydrofolate dehydrogenase/methenyltetrahydrofolate cyclohydrolase [Kiritimatiellales bacterium]|nr:bifunctional methylenetetrahydrofolate dehydrogenase/methenyltetrahydrofolate cyclohydrolase [Kiritimatiellales bacterium]